MFGHHHGSKKSGSKKSQRGAALVEYAILIGAVTLVGVLGVSILGHKTNDLTGALAVMLPGAHTDDDITLTAGQLIEMESTAVAGSGFVASFDDTAVLDATQDNRFLNNTGIDATNFLVD